MSSCTQMVLMLVRITALFIKILSIAVLHAGFGQPAGAQRKLEAAEHHDRKWRHRPKSAAEPWQCDTTGEVEAGCWERGGKPPCHSPNKHR
jgi:hypothetical protein